MLRISQAQWADGTVTFLLEGIVAGPWVGELCRICEPLLHEGSKLALDLADVSFADASGVVLLSNFKSRGVSLMKANPFLEEQLRAGTGGAGREAALRRPRP